MWRAWPAIWLAFGVARVTQAQSLSQIQADRSGRDVLARTVSVSLANVPLSEALLTLRRTHNVPLAWSGDVVPTDLRVTVGMQNASLGSVLTALLAGSGLQVVVTRLGTIVVVPSAGMNAAPSNAQSSLRRDTVALHVTAALSRGLTATGVQQLDQVVVMGSTVSGGPERELPVAVTVVSAERLRASAQGRFADLVRAELPALILWDRGPTGPPAPIAAVRGVASFTTRALKTYVDGVEVASPELFTLVDGRSIERLEMIRGPQGAALYGPDALNGIVQIETRHGHPGRKQWQARALAGAGFYERVDLAMAQPSADAAAGFTGSTSRSAFDASASVANVGRDSASRQLRSWTAQSGARLLAGPVLLELSARAAQHEYMAKRIAAAAASPSIPQQLDERALAFTATQQITERWRQSLVAGHHWISGDREPFRSPLLPPRLPVGATFETAARSSVRYATSLAVARVFELSGGAEYSVRNMDRKLSRSTVLTQLSELFHDELRSTGTFAQARWHIGPQFTVSGGVRGEHLSSVGSRLGTVWASTAGASWNREFDGATVRLRTAWGRGIRAPEPGMNVNRVAGTLRQVANPSLAPERQQGVEAGADFFFAQGAFFKATLYDQRATDLIQQVSLRIPVGTVDTYQFQNVGVVQNRGVELEGGLRWSHVSAGATLQMPRSEVRQLSPRYTGELLPGDRLVEVPEAAGSAWVRYASAVASRKWSAEFGATGLGAWTGYDWILLARIERGLATRREAVRDYWMRYPGVVRPYFTTSLELGRDVHAFVRVDNLANHGAYIRDNASPPLGRTSVVGVEWRGR